MESELKKIETGKKKKRVHRNNEHLTVLCT